LRFYTQEECELWLSGRKRMKPDSAPGLQTQRFGYPLAFQRLVFVARWVATSLTYDMPALLWITEWGIWSENLLHLYYRLRQSYDDHRLLEEAPGHLFLQYEMEDLASFLQIAMLNGWGGYILTQAD